MKFFQFRLDSVQDSYIYGYASIFIKGNFFIIGGKADGTGTNSNTIARLNTATWSWSRAGRLNTARRGHGAIWSKSKLIIVGGDYDTYTTEFCTLKDNKFTCTDLKSTLKGYGFHPLLFMVSDDYKQC